MFSVLLVYFWQQLFNIMVLIFFFLWQVKERPDVGVYIKDLSGYVVNNADDMDRIMTLGHKNRKQNTGSTESEIDATKLNADLHSS